MENIIKELNNPSAYFVCTLILLVISYISQLNIFAKPGDLTKLELKIKEENEKKYLTKEFYIESKENINKKFDKLDENITKIEQQNSRILEILIGKE